MKKKKVIYDPSLLTYFKFYAMGLVLIIKGHLKYMDDPAGMLNDPQYCDFAIPFRDYAKGEISFEEAKIRLKAIRSTIKQDFAESWLDLSLRIQHEKISGGDLIEDRNSLRSQNERTAKDAALRILKSFPQTRSKCEDIKKVISKAIGDNDFFDELIKNIDEKQRHHAKRELGLIKFKIFNEEILKDPNLTEEDVLKMADEQKLFYQSRDSLLKYLRRQGIRMKTGKGKIKKEAANKSATGFDQEIVWAKRTEFKKYLFGNTPIRKIKQQISILKKSLKIK